VVSESGPLKACHAPALFLITGVMASGKSTVAQHLAERLRDSVHLRGDVFRRMIVNGRVEMTRTPSPTAEKQLRLRYRLAASTVRQAMEAGFNVVYQDVILGPWLTEVAGLYTSLPLHVIVLSPSPAIVAAREAGRVKQGYRDFTPQEMDEVFRRTTPRIGLWLDNSAWSVTETVDQILARQADARVHA